MFHDLETERLFLRSLSRNDRDFMLAQFSDPDVTQYLYDAEPLANLEDADRLISFYVQPEPRTQHRWILVQKSDGKRIGTCGFHRWDVEKGCVEIGYDLQNGFRGQGLMSEALHEALRFAETEMSIRTVDAQISTSNLQSIALVEKMGFKYAGEAKPCVFRGVAYPHASYTLRLPNRKEVPSDHGRLE